MRFRQIPGALVVAVLIGASVCRAEEAGNSEQVLIGQQAYGDWHDDAPGRRRHLSPADMPKPFASQSSSNTPSVVTPPQGRRPQVPPGFSVERFATLENPRLVRVAPNGDIFVAETASGKIRVLRAPDGAAHPDRDELFASDLQGPFGIAFYPQGADPHWLYVATINSVIRYPYRAGDLTPAGSPQTIVASLAGTEGYHTTRDIQFSPDNRTMYVSVGSGSNDAEDMARRSADRIRQWESQRGPDAAWGRRGGSCGCPRLRP